MRKKVYLILLLVSLLALGVGAASPAAIAAAQSNQNQTSACEDASTFLVGRVAELPGVQDLIHDTCDYRLRMNQIKSKVSRFDVRFIESAIAANMLEIQTLQYTLERTENEEWRGLLQMMITMHTSDLEMALEVAERIGADTTPDLTNARVYPQTPEYDLGMRRINLVARFLDPLMSTPGGVETPTAIPTDMTVAPTVTGTIPAPLTPTGSATFQPLTPTAAATDTAPALPTGTATEVATETGTAISTGTTTAVPTETVTPIETATTTALPTGTGTALATVTITPSPTVVTPTRPDFDLLSLHILEDEHVMSVEVALVAQRLAKNNEIRAFAKHAADVAKLHLLLMNDLKYRLAHGYTLPEPMFEEEYQSPRRLEPAGDEN